MPYNVPATVKSSTDTNGRSNGNRTRRNRKSTRGNNHSSTSSSNPDDVLGVSAVMDQMQNPNEREYVAQVPQADNQDNVDK